MDATEFALRREIEYLQKRANRLEAVLSTLINWMAQSANSPIRHDEAVTLLNKLESTDEGEDE